MSADVQFTAQAIEPAHETFQHPIAPAFVRFELAVLCYFIERELSNVFAGSIVKCAIPGCDREFESTEPVSPSARFICSHHPVAVQLEAVGRDPHEPVPAQRSIECVSSTGKKGYFDASPPARGLAINKLLSVQDEGKQRFVDVYVPEEPRLTDAHKRTLGLVSSYEVLQALFPRPSSLVNLKKEYEPANHGSETEPANHGSETELCKGRRRCTCCAACANGSSCPGAGITLVLIDEPRDTDLLWSDDLCERLKANVQKGFLAECEAAQALRTEMIMEARQRSGDSPEVRQWRIDDAAYWNRVANDPSFRRNHRPPEPPSEALWEAQLLREGRGKSGKGIEDLVPVPKLLWDMDEFLRVRFQGPKWGKAGLHYRDHDFQTPRDSESGRSDDDDPEENAEDEYSEANGFRHSKNYYTRDTTTSDSEDSVAAKKALFKERAKRGEYESSIDPDGITIITEIDGQAAMINLANEEFRHDAISLEMDVSNISERTANEIVGQKSEGRYMSNRDYQLKEKFETLAQTDPTDEFLEAWEKEFGDTPLHTGIFVLVDYENQATKLYELDLAKYGGNADDPFDPINYVINDRGSFSQEIGGEWAELDGSPTVAALKRLAQQKATKAMRQALNKAEDDPSDLNHPATPALKAGRAAYHRVWDAFEKGVIYKIRTGPGRFRFERGASLVPPQTGWMVGLQER